MTDLQHARQLNALLEAALETGVDCYAFAMEATREDPELRGELLSLLELEVSTGYFQEEPTKNMGQLLNSRWQVGYRLGSYRLGRELGHGGMGTVFEAHRADDSFDKKVAVKLMRPSLYGPETLARFHEERQILAKLEHPNITRLIDGGTTPEGIPYLVMEYIEGVPITHFCRGLPLEQRLRLFRDLCSAVHFAHRHLVAHRDLKPDNILVTPEGVVKLLDFGIARALGAEKKGLTQTGRHLMSPMYASPEQVQGRGITTATDIYSLGVILFQLCSGCLPYELSRGTFEELHRVIVTTPPMRPADALKRALRKSTNPTDNTARTSEEISADFGLLPKHLLKRLRGELEAVVLKCLEKEPEDRYSAVDHLAEDLECFLDGRPVNASRPGYTRRLYKHMLRHKVASASLLAVFVLMVFFLAQLSLKNRSIARERDHAREQFARAEAVTNFLMRTYKQADPYNAGERGMSAREMLDGAFNDLDHNSSQDPTDKARLYRVIGGIFHSQGYYDKALRALNKAIALFETPTTGNPEDRMMTFLDIAQTTMMKGELEQAESWIDRSLAIYAREGGNYGIVALADSTLAQIYYLRGDLARAEAILTEAIPPMKNKLPKLGAVVSRSLNTLASIHARREEFILAENFYRESLEHARAFHQGNSPDISSVLSNLGLTLLNLQRFEEAEQFLREGLTMNRVQLGQHLTVSANISNLAKLLIAVNCDEEAETLLLEDQEMLKTLLGPDHFYRAVNFDRLAGISLRRGDLAQALARQEAALPIFRRHPDVEPGRYERHLEQLAQTAERLGNTERLSEYRIELTSWRENRK